MERPKGPLADEAALEQAMRQYQAELLRYAAGILGSWADAEDAVQTAFLKVWQRRARLRPDTMLRPLLYRVTCRNALDQLRRARREARREPAPAQAEPAPWLGVEVRAALDALPPADRALVWGQVVEGLSYRELAAIHGKSENYLRNRCCRAKRRLGRGRTADDALPGVYPFADRFQPGRAGRAGGGAGRLRRCRKPKVKPYPQKTAGALRKPMRGAPVFLLLQG